MKKNAKNGSNASNVKGELRYLVIIDDKLPYSITFIDTELSTFLQRSCFREQREREQREREQREKEQREKEQREKEREREERERHFAAAQMYAAEMQRNLFLSGFHSRSPLGLGLGFPPGGLPPHMAGHPFSHLSAMAGVAGIPSLSHTSPIPTSYGASSSSLNLSLSQSRNHVSSSPVGGGGVESAAPAHSSNIPALPKHYLPPHKTDSSKHKQHPAVSMPLTSIASTHDTSMYMSSERHANSLSNRNSSNHNSANSHLNAEQHQSKGLPPKSIYAMQRESHRTPTRVSAASYTGADVAAAASASASASASTTPVECKYSISLERINSNLVTNKEREQRNEPMELSVSSDAIQKLQLQLQQQQHQHQQQHQQQQQQAKFNPEQISPKKRQLIGSDTKMIHQSDELKNGCQERPNEAKDLSGRYSLYDAMSHYQPATSTSATIDLRSSSSDERSASDSMRHQMPYGSSADRQRSFVQSPETFSKEPMVSNTSLEHDSTISKDNNNKLSKTTISDVEQENANANANENAIVTDTSTVTTTAATITAVAVVTTTASIDASPTTTPAITVTASEATTQQTENETSDRTDTDAAKSTTPTESPSKNTTDEPMDSRENSPPSDPHDTPKPSDTLDATAQDAEPCGRITTDNADKDSSDGTAVAEEPVELAPQTKS